MEEWKEGRDFWVSLTGLLLCGFAIAVAVVLQTRVRTLCASNQVIDFFVPLKLCSLARMSLES